MRRWRELTALTGPWPLKPEGKWTLQAAVSQEQAWTQDGWSRFVCVLQEQRRAREYSHPHRYKRSHADIRLAGGAAALGRGGHGWNAGCCWSLVHGQLIEK